MSTILGMPAVRIRKLSSALIVQARYTFWVIATREDGTEAWPVPCETLTHAEQRKTGFEVAGYSNVHIRLRKRGCGGPGEHK